MHARDLRGLAHRELKKVPGSVKRHSVERVPDVLREQLFRQVARDAARVPSGGGSAANASFFEKIGGSFRRLFA